MPQTTQHWMRRQDAIREILSSGNVRSQLDLVAELRRRGFQVTQSSVSRDLREMRIAKVEGRYVPLEASTGAEGGLRATREFVESVAAAGPHILVIRTRPGGASPVGLAIDQAAWPEVVGTVAGDDTLFVATAHRRDQRAIEARFLELLVDRD